MVTLNQQISEVRREIALRQHVYPKRVLAKFMSQVQADYHLSAMEAVLQTLECLAMADQGQLGFWMSDAEAVRNSHKPQNTEGA